MTKMQLYARALTLWIVTLALVGCEQRPATPDLKVRQQEIVAAHLTTLDADWARLRLEGKFRPYTPSLFTYSAPDERNAKALVEKLKREATYTSGARAPGAGDGGWTVVGETTILPNERPYHGKLVPIMVEMGLVLGCELQSWELKLEDRTP